MINKILVAVDRSPLGKSVFNSAVSLAQTTGANLMLLHVLSPEEPDRPVEPLQTYYPIVEGKGYEAYQKEYEEYNQRGLKFLQNLAEEATKAGINPEYTQLSGNSGRMISQLASNWSADLIVVGSRGLKGLKEMFLGSVSNYVTHHAPCSVLIVRQPIDSESESKPTESEASNKILNSNA